MKVKTDLKAGCSNSCNSCSCRNGGIAIAAAYAFAAAGAFSASA
jgi:hypothetical protein